MSPPGKGTTMTTRNNLATDRELSSIARLRSGMRTWQAAAATILVAAAAGLAIAVPLHMRGSAHSSVRQSSRAAVIAGPVTPAIQQAHLRSEEASNAVVDQA